MGAMPSLFLSALILGIAFCAPPGTVTAEALRRGCQRGFRSVFHFQMGALAGSAVWAAIGLSGGIVLGQLSLVRLLLGLVGAGLVLRMARTALHDARCGQLPSASIEPYTGDFTAGLVMCLANPFAAAFWLAVSGGLLPSGGAVSHLEHAGVTVAGFLLGSLLYRGGFAVIVGWGRRFLTVRTYRWLNGLCGVTLVYFSLQLLVGTLRLL